jgi:ABC-2 type transport system ATP-binding protein
VLVETHGLTKIYGSFTALADFTFGVARGEVFGLLGPNGAGKTTLLRLLLGFLRPTRGTATVDGLDCYRESVAVHRRLAYLPGDARLFRRMRGSDVLKFFAEVRTGGDFARSLAIAERLELDTRRRVASMSTGMRQKVALAATMAADVPLVILDEPTSNLDPTMRSVVSRLVREAQAAGRTVLFSSHVMSEVEEVCDRVVIVRRGELVHTQVMKELRARHLIRAQLRGKLPDPPAEFRDQLTILPSTNGNLTIETPGSLAPLLGWLATLPLEDLQVERAGLQRIYNRYHHTQ